MPSAWGVWATVVAVLLGLLAVAPPQRQPCGGATASVPVAVAVAVAAVIIFLAYAVGCFCTAARCHRPAALLGHGGGAERPMAVLIIAHPDDEAMFFGPAMR